MITKNDYHMAAEFTKLGRTQRGRGLGDENLMEGQEFDFEWIESEVPVRHPGWGCQVEFGVLSSGEHSDCEIYLRINSILVVSVGVEEVLREKRKKP